MFLNNLAKTKLHIGRQRKKNEKERKKKCRDVLPFRTRNNEDEDDETNEKDPHEATCSKITRQGQFHQKDLSVNRHGC